MKKIYLLLAGVLLSASVMAQNTVTNDSFENWNSGMLSTNEQPEGWTTGLIGNVLIELFGQNLPMPVNTYFGVKSTDAHYGNYALQLQANTVGIPGTEYSAMFPGIAQLGEAEGFNIPLATILNMVESFSSIMGGDTAGFNWEDLDLSSLQSLSQALAPGEALSQTPAHLNMWVKFVPQEGDMLNVIAFTKSGGVPVGYAVYNTEETMSDYTLISIPFENAFESCDTLAIIIAAGGLQSNANTLFLVDDIMIDYDITDGVAEFGGQQFSCYPNPTRGSYFIKPQGEEPYQYEVYDMTGRLVVSDNNRMGLTTLNTSNWSNGVYVLKINQNGQTYPQKIVVR